MTENKLKKVKAYLFDMDGTLYLGGTLIDGAKETLDFLRKNNKKVFFLTNNSSISVKDYLVKLKKYGLTDSIDEICSSSLSTIAYLKKNGLTQQVFLVGTNSLKTEFIESGIELVESDPQTVVLSYDKELNYEKLEKLTKYIVKGANYVATHEDVNCPNDDVYLPDIGSMMALVEKSTGKKPMAICGKPRKIMAEYIEELLCLQSHEIAMIGDRLMTDISFGINNNFVSVLVLSGETTEKALQESGMKPNYVFCNTYGIVEELNRNKI